jgi:hypothetical protein
MRAPNKSEIKILRERFIIDFCKKRGWNHNELTTGQMMIIINQQDYKSPNLKIIK